MKDISQKIKTLRTATATATLKVSTQTISLIKENKVPKGNPLEVAKIAGIQAAKNSSNIIPYCHQIPIDFISVDFEIKEYTIEITTNVKAIYKTGVEMEALTSASVAALTLYDMLKMLDKDMEITEIKLLSKKGGKLDYRHEFNISPKAAVLVMSDSVSNGKEDDLSGKLIRERLKNENIDVVDYKIISDDTETIQQALKKYADEMKLDLVITTGGTGLGPRDNTPEATNNIIEREIPGIPEYIRAYGQEKIPYSMFSRGQAGLRKNTIIINLPGSKSGVTDSLDAVFPAILHLLKVVKGFDHRIENHEKEKVKR